MKKGANVVQQEGMRMMPQPVQWAEQGPVIREASTGRIVVVLPRVWAVGTEPTHDDEAVVKGAPRLVARVAQSRQAGHAAPGTDAMEAPKVEVAFYRKYTEGMLRRYLRLSMESGRVPSLLGREMFRGKVTSYRVRAFDDVVIFCHDMEKRLKMLEPLDRELIKRITLQEYTQGEAAGMVGVSLRTCIRKYGRALDRLTELLLEAKMLEPLKGCQEGGRR
jgi:predicted DNA-binding protein (UPF0251 family)